MSYRARDPGYGANKLGSNNVDFVRQMMMSRKTQIHDISQSPSTSTSTSSSSVSSIGESAWEYGGFKQSTNQGKNRCDSTVDTEVMSFSSNSVMQNGEVRVISVPNSGYLDYPQTPQRASQIPRSGYGTPASRRSRTSTIATDSYGTYQEKQVLKVDRVKAKAIRSSRNSYGMQGRVQPNKAGAGRRALPNQPMHYSTGGQTSSSATNPRHGSLAEALAMKIDPSRNAAPIRQGPKSKKGLFDAVMQRVASSEQGDSESDSDSSESTPGGNRMRAPQHGSLAAALGMSIDTSPKAAAIRQKNSSSASIEPRNGSLAAALGMKVDNSPHASAICYTPQPKKRSLFDAVIGSMQATNTAPFGTEFKKGGKYDSARPQEGSLAEALGMGIDPSPNAAAIREQRGRYTPRKKSLFEAVLGNMSHSSQMILRQPMQKPMASSNPRAGSLAEALGMKIDSSPHAAPVREDPVTPRKKSLFDAVLHNMESPTRVTFQDMHQRSALNNRSQNSPNKGSLAAALGMSIDPTNTAAPVRMANSTSQRSHSAMDDEPVHVRRSTKWKSMLNSLDNPDFASLGINLSNEMTEKESSRRIRQVQPRQQFQQFDSNPQAGSLAAALGMKVDLSPGAAAIRQPPTKTPKKKSLFDAVLSNMHVEQPSYPANRQPFQQAPQEGSLAAALGIRVDHSPKAAAIRQTGSTNTGRKKKILFDALLTNMHVEEVSHRSAPTRSFENSPRDGSLAAALGMQIDTSPKAAAIRQKSQNKKKKSLFDAVLGNMNVEQPITPTTQARPPQAGSLAAALGMQIDCSPRAAAIRHTPKKKSLFDAVLNNMSSASHPPIKRKPNLMDAVMKKVAMSPRRDSGWDSDSSYDSTSVASVDDYEVRVALPQQGSLAAALGMQIDTRPRAAAIRHTPSSPKKKSLFDAVLNNMSSTSRPPMKKKPNLMDAVMKKMAMSPGGDGYGSETSYDDETSGSESDDDYMPSTRRSAPVPSVPPQMGSLAEALGMKVDPSPYAASIRQDGGVHKSGKKKKSLFDAVLNNMAAY